MNTIEQIHADVWAFRDKYGAWWKTPEPDDCIRYAFTEAGELMDAYLRSKRTGDARNNENDVSIAKELADVAIMLVSAMPELSEWNMNEYHSARDYISFDEICRSIGDLLHEKAQDGFDICSVLWDIVDFSYDSHYEISSQVRANLEEIKIKHVPGVVLASERKEK